MRPLSRPIWEDRARCWLKRFWYWLLASSLATRASSLIVSASYLMLEDNKGKHWKLVLILFKLSIDSRKLWALVKWKFKISAASRYRRLLPEIDEFIDIICSFSRSTNFRLMLDRAWGVLLASMCRIRLTDSEKICKPDIKVIIRNEVKHFINRRSYAWFLFDSVEKVICDSRRVGIRSKDVKRLSLI